MNNILTERKYNIDGNWYESQHFLENFSSVIRTELYNTCSSAGNWDGFFIQKIGKRFYMIGFNQENNYPFGGYTLHTGNLIASFKSMLEEEELYKIYDEVIYQ